MKCLLPSFKPTATFPFFASFWCTFTTFVLNFVFRLPSSPYEIHQLLGTVLHQALVPRAVVFDRHLRRHAVGGPGRCRPGPGLPLAILPCSCLERRSRWPRQSRQQRWQRCQRRTLFVATIVNDLVLVASFFVFCIVVFCLVVFIVVFMVESIAAPSLPRRFAGGVLRSRGCLPEAPLSLWRDDLAQWRRVWLWLVAD